MTIPLAILTGAVALSHCPDCGIWTTRLCAMCERECVHDAGRDCSHSNRFVAPASPFHDHTNSPGGQRNHD